MSNPLIDGKSMTEYVELSSGFLIKLSEYIVQENSNSWSFWKHDETGELKKLYTLGKEETYYDDTYIRAMKHVFFVTSGYKGEYRRKFLKDISARLRNPKDQGIANQLIKNDLPELNFYVLSTKKIKSTGIVVGTMFSGMERKNLDKVIEALEYLPCSMPHLVSQDMIDESVDEFCHMNKIKKRDITGTYYESWSHDSIRDRFTPKDVFEAYEKHYRKKWRKL